MGSRGAPSLTFRSTGGPTRTRFTVSARVGPRGVLPGEVAGDEAVEPGRDPVGPRSEAMDVEDEDAHRHRHRSQDHYHHQVHACNGRFCQRVL